MIYHPKVPWRDRARVQRAAKRAAAAENTAGIVVVIERRSTRVRYWHLGEYGRKRHKDALAAGAREVGVYRGSDMDQLYAAMLADVHAAINEPWPPSS